MGTTASIVGPADGELIRHTGWEVGPGGIAFGPAGTVHDFEIGPAGGRLLHSFVPSGMEGYFRTPRSPGGGDDLRTQYEIESVRT